MKRKEPTKTFMMISDLKKAWFIHKYSSVVGLRELGATWVQLFLNKAVTHEEIEDTHFYTFALSGNVLISFKGSVAGTIGLVRKLDEI